MESTPGGTTAADGGGGQAGVDPIPCGGPDDCDDGDAANGPEDCGQDGICVAGNPPPTVVATSPERDTTDVELTTEIVIEFSEALDPATVTAQSVQLLDGERALDGELAYGDRKVTFTPDSPLALLAEYTIKVTTAVTDEDGAALLESFATRFVSRDGTWSTIDAVIGRTGSALHIPETLSLTADGRVLVASLLLPPSDAASKTKCRPSVRWFRAGAAVEGIAPTTFKEVGDCSHLAAASNAEGVAAFAWKPITLPASVEQYRSGAWTNGGAQPITNAGDSPLFGVGIAPDGRTSFLQHVVAGGTLARRSDANGAWGAAAVEVAAGHEGLSSPRVVFDLEGDGFAIWRAEDASNRDEIVVARYTADEGWQQATPLPGSLANNAVATAERGAPAIAVDDDGGALALWLRETNATTGSIVASRYGAGGTWSNPVVVSGTLLAVDMLDAPGLIFDGSNYVAAFTAKDGESHHVYSAVYDVSLEQWGASEPRFGGVALARMPGLGTDAHGNLHLMWVQQGASNQATMVTARYDGTTDEWRDAIFLPGGIVRDDPVASHRPFPLGVAASGFAAVIWGDGDGTVDSVANIRLASFY